MATSDTQTSEAEVQALLRQEIADLQAALAERFDEIAALTRILEEERAAQADLLAQQAARIEARHEVRAILARVRAARAEAQASGAAPDATQDRQRAAIADSPLFDAAWYLERNADVGQIGMDPLEHYVLAGGLEGRDPGPRFSSMGYYIANRDVAEAGWTALGHYLLSGRDEGRQGGEMPAPDAAGAGSEDPA